MRRWGIGLAALAVAAASLAATQPSHPELAVSLPATKEPRPLLGIVGERGIGRLVRLDPRSLRPLRGPSLQIFNGARAWAFSPDRSRLALGTGCQAGVSLGSLELVDVRRMRPIACFALGNYVEATAWPTRNRLLVLAHSPLQVVLIDPTTRRIIDRTLLEGVGLATAGAGRRLVFLTGLPDGTHALVVADAHGSVRSVRVEAARATDVVLDPSGRRAFLVSAGAVAEVDLDTLAVAYHELSEQRSVFGRLLAWLVPAAQAKPFHRETRGALWVGGGLIASFGSDITVDGRQFRSVPAGLRLIDTNTWTVRTVDEQVSSALLVGDVLLAAGAKEIGLVAYELNGTKRFQLFRGRSVAPVESQGSKAWIDVGRQPFRIVDVRTGRVVGSGPVPTVLVEP